MKTWFVEVNEWLDEQDKCMSGLAYSPGWLEEMEMTGHGMVEVIEKSAYDELMAALEQIAERHSDAGYNLSMIAKEVLKRHVGVIK